jgi:hypothetical protein
MLSRRTEAKIPLGRPRNRWENNIGVDLKDRVYENVGWIQLA